MVIATGHDVQKKKEYHFSFFSSTLSVLSDLINFILLKKWRNVEKIFFVNVFVITLKNSLKVFRG